MSIHAIGAMGGQPLLEPLLKEILNGKHRYAWLYANRVAVSSVADPLPFTYEGL